MVDRYYVNGFIQKSNTGDLVKYKDYIVLESRIAELEQRNRALVEALKAIEEGCSYPEDEVQRAVRDRAKQALKEAEQCPTQP